MCAHAVRVAVGKIDGVRDVKVSLNEGAAMIQFAPSNRVSIEQVRKAIRSNGFTPRGADVRVAGLLMRQGDTLILRVTGSEDAFVLQDAPAVAGQLATLRKMKPGALLTVNGQVPERAGTLRRDARPVLLVRSMNAN